MIDRKHSDNERLICGIAPGFAVIACRYAMVGILFCVPGIFIISMSWAAIHTPFSSFTACLAGIAFGSLFILIGAGILGLGYWWLRRATHILRHVRPVPMQMHTHTRMVHDGAGPGPGDALTTAFARLTPSDPTLGLRTFKRVPLEWPTWRLRWQPPAESEVSVYYDFVTGGPLVIQTAADTLLLSQILWDHQRRKRKSPPTGGHRTDTIPENMN